MAGKQVVHLGSGSGIVAVAAAKCGAARVQAFEVDPLALAAINLNGAVNGVTIENSSVDILAGETRVEADVLLLGDLFYEAGMAGHVLGLAERSQAAGAIVVAGDPGRSYFPYERFQILASYDVPVSRELEDADVKKTRVWQFS